MSGVFSIAISRDALKIFSGSKDKEIRIWNTMTGEFIKVLEGHSHTILSIAISLDESMLASCSLDNTIKFW